MYTLKDLIKADEKDLSKIYNAHRSPIPMTGKKRVNILAMGDVGSTVLMGLKLMGGDILKSIGICDIEPKNTTRMEMEMNQISLAWEYENFPRVEIVDNSNLFDADMMIFCASIGVPPVTEKVKDVRMVQFAENRKLIRMFARLARERNFKGIFAVVSDPVDPLCKEVLLESNKDENGNYDNKGLRGEQVQGFGLGVMNARAAYYAKKFSRFESFLTEGLAFGPHGKDLVIANSLKNYDHDLSLELTKLTVEANLEARKVGFKPYIAPALSSGALSILETLRGNWHYSSNLWGSVYLGTKNRMTEEGIEIENINLPDLLFRRINDAYENLKEISYE